MRLTKLEMQGFKSFAKKTELQFGSGITAVIGPNGSGKSNISDAVRWVLGEQSARALRGAKMEDVIFNGTQKRRPLGMAEVTLSFDNTDHSLPVDYAEVAVTRRVYRNGESEYAINGKTCRLKDVLELFRDTGIGRDGYSIISQGKVDEILSNKSSDRRSALEEAAGVMRYRVRRTEAEKKLENTQKNMERIGDILHELEGRVGPLREQREKALRYQEARGELQRLEVNLFLHETEKNRAKIVEQQAVLQELQEKLSGIESEDSVLQEASHELEDRIRALDEKLDEGQKRALELLSRVEGLQGEEKLSEARRESLEKERERLVAEAEAQAKEAADRQQILDSMGNLSDEERNALQQQIDEMNAALSALQTECEQAEGALEEKKNRIMEELNRLSDKKSSLSRLSALEQSLGERAEVIRNELASNAQRYGQLQEEKAQAQTEQRQLLARRETCREALKRARENQSQLLSEQEAETEALRQREQESGALSSRLHVLEEMARKREGYQNSVRLIMDYAERDVELRQRIVGVVAELIHVPERYEVAVGTALGGAQQNLVSRTGRDAKYIIETLRRKEFGRCTILPLDLLSENGVREKDRHFLQEKGVIGLACDLIRWEDGMDKAVEYLLGRTVVVEDLSVGVSLKERSGGVFQIVTLKGDLITPGGAMTGGSTQRKSFGILGREREIAELKKKYAELETARREAIDRVTKKKQQVVLATVQVDGLVRDLHDRDIDLEKQNDKLAIIERDMASAQADREKLEEEQTANGENVRSIRERIELLNSEQIDLEAHGTVSRQEVMAQSKALFALRKQRDEQAEALTELRLRYTAVMKEASAREAERERLTREMQRCAERQTALLENAQRVRQEAEATAQTICVLQSQVEEAKGDLADAQQEQQKVEDQRTLQKEELRLRRTRRDELLGSTRALLDSRTRAEMTLGKLQTALEQQQDRIWQTYGLTYENALQLKEDIPITSSGQRAAKLREQIRALGTVNLDAIEEYAQVSERFENLSRQYDDLTSAAQDLYTLIEKLTKTMEKVFAGEFDRVQGEFKKVFVALFGGGQAELRLSDPKDVLNCDIDIIAQPPGKKLQLLSLMSGGERALTAIALLFAMLRVKSPAFCFLDEIETSLDEANVGRFAQFVREYGKQTQFILITHRKGSMEVCNTLYGVAMEEKGVSTIVSAKFEEAV
ncbi:MAG: chromosome segregation protein SMC [Clostridia bacterium]|nr:chromosome segregation protein SMC [Clostridia bacterium]